MRLGFLYGLLDIYIPLLRSRNVIPPFLNILLSQVDYDLPVSTVAMYLLHNTITSYY